MNRHLPTFPDGSGDFWLAHIAGNSGQVGAWKTTLAAIMSGMPVEATFDELADGFATAALRMAKIVEGTTIRPRLIDQPAAAIRAWRGRLGPYHRAVKIVRDVDARMARRYRGVTGATRSQARDDIAAIMDRLTHLVVHLGDDRQAIVELASRRLVPWIAARRPPDDELAQVESAWTAHWARLRRGRGAANWADDALRRSYQQAWRDVVA